MNPAFGWIRFNQVYVYSQNLINIMITTTHFSEGHHQGNSNGQGLHQRHCCNEQK